MKPSARWALHTVAGESGQMAVELAIVMPLLLVVMVLAVDALIFVGECARFDHLAAQAVLAQGASPAAGDYDLSARAANVKRQLSDSFVDTGGKVTVKTEEHPGLALWDTCTFTCTLKMAPWPFRAGSLSVFGAEVPTALTHSYKLTVEPYTPGEVL